MSPLPACAATAAAGVYTVYKPRRPQASPLFRLVSDHFRAFHAAYEERFAATYGDWRPVVREVADKLDRPATAPTRDASPPQRIASPGGAIEIPIPSTFFTPPTEAP